MAIEHQTQVLVVGGGPAGLIFSLSLAQHGVKCMLVERNLDTTKWPKMDITNARSMEIFRRLGIANGLREQGVPQDFSFDVLFSTGLNEDGQVISKWTLPSPNEWREKVKRQNDGTMPREPYQRCSQAIFEAWLKPRIQAEPLIDSHFGLKLESLVEKGDLVESTLTDVVTGETHLIRSQFVVGCDGAGSRVRKAIGSELIGGPLPFSQLLVHFKSKDLTTLHKQGQFWHIFMAGGGVVIAQDEVDTWTTHLPLPVDSDWESIDPHEAVSRVLGGSGRPTPIKIDKVLISNCWRPRIAIADKYASDSLRIFIAGDAAHQNPPTGGYGMNTAVGDSFDLAWKLAATINKWGGKQLLVSYEAERKPIGVRNIERAGVHGMVHGDYMGWVQEAGPGIVTSDTTEGRNLREKIARHVTNNDGENRDHGIELGYRYNGSPVVVSDGTESEPQESVRNYIPSTWPGARAPHVFLSDGETSIFDLFGRGFSIVDFTADGRWAAALMPIAFKYGIPLKEVLLPHEAHARSIWGRDAVMVRPDDHVAWRSPAGETEVEAVDLYAVMRICSGQGVSSKPPTKNTLLEKITSEGFTGADKLTKQEMASLTVDFQ